MRPPSYSSSLKPSEQLFSNIALAKLSKYYTLLPDEAAKISPQHCIFCANVEYAPEVMARYRQGYTQVATHDCKFSFSYRFTF